MDRTASQDLLRRVRRAVAWYRRPLTALLAGLAVVAGLSALRPAPSPVRAVWVAARDLGGGAPLTPSDIRLRRLPTTAVPSHALGATVRVVGRLLAAPVRRGEPLTDVRLLEPPLLAAVGRGREVAAAVRVADGAAAAALVRPGDVVDVLATPERADGSAGHPLVVATAVTVLAVPPRDPGRDDAGLVLVATDVTTASVLAAAAGGGTRLSLILRRPA